METKTKKLTRSAVMIALSCALSLFAVLKLPNGGSVTIGSMVPLLLIAFQSDTKWALLTAFTYSILQMVLGFYPPPTQDLLSFVLVILLDYVIAFSVLGLAGVITKKMKGITNKVVIGSTVVLFLRFLCHFLSGILIWNSYAEGQNVLIYSLLYNGSYMLGELIVTIVIMLIISKLSFFKRSIL